MSEAKLTLISAAAGAAAVIIGALIAGLFNYLQSARQDRRDAIKLAAEAAWKDYELRVDKGIPSSPAFIFVWYHVRLMQLIERDKLTREAIAQVHLQKDELTKAFADIAEERGTRAASSLLLLLAVFAASIMIST